MRIVALALCAVAVCGVARAAGPAPGAPRLYIADFLQNGYDGAAGRQVADLLARALSETGRFDVERVPSASADPRGFFRARAGRTGRAWLVEGGIRGLRAVGSSSVGLGGIGFGRSRGMNRLFRGTPGNLAMSSAFSVDGWLRVHDANDGSNLGQKRFCGWTIGLLPTYWYRGGPIGQVLDASILDEKTGAVRVVMGLLPLEGRIVSASAENTAVVDVGLSGTVSKGEH